MDFSAFPRTIVVTGHYGSGKTNLALNIARQLRLQGENVALADLDIVNPYFKTSEFRPFARELGIELIASDYSGGNLDIPSISPRLQAAIERFDGRLIIDVGGDDAGAAALGRFSETLERTGYAMLYVLNAYRFFVRRPTDAALLMREIEKSSRLSVTALVNASNLGTETVLQTLKDSESYARAVSDITGLPVAFTAMKKELVPANSPENIFPTDILVKTPWQ